MIRKKPALKKGGVKSPDSRVVPVVSVIDAAVAIMKEEASLLAEGRIAAIEPFMERKKDAEAAIMATWRDAVEAGLSVVAGSPEAGAVEAALERLREASVANAEALQGTHDALERVSAVIRKASLENGSEGMYGRNAKMVFARGAGSGFGAAI